MIKVKGIVERTNISHTKIWCRRSNGNGEGINQKIGMVECSTTYHQTDFSVSFKFLVDRSLCFASDKMRFFHSVFGCFRSLCFQFWKQFSIYRSDQIYNDTLQPTRMKSFFYKCLCACVACRFAFFVFHLLRRSISFSISNHHHWIPFIVVIVVV